MDKEEGFNKKTKGERETKVVQFAQVINALASDFTRENGDCLSLFVFFWEAWKQGF